MYNIIIGTITIIGWVAGQFLIFSGHVSNGIALIVFFTVAGAIFYFRVWKILTPGAGGALLGKKTPIMLATLAIITAATATLVLKDSPHESLALYMLSGFLLFMATPKNEKIFDSYEIPENKPPMQKWEPWFLFVLFAVSAFIRLYELRNIPQVGNGGEGLIWSICTGLAANGAAYVPHVGGGTDWPTMTYYIGIAFAKVFGWNIETFRASSAIFGILSILAFYFLVRRLTSPFSAAITALMYTIFIPHLAMSRQFIPVFPLLFLPHIICIYFLITANKDPKWYLFLAAGLACGFSLQGYVPGRGIFLLFIGWFVLMAVTGKKIFYKPSNFFIFWGAFVIVASPVIVYALARPDQYWGYVHSVDPNVKSGGIGYIKTIFNSIPMYTGMFYTKNAFDVVQHYPYKPLFDPVLATLFSAGFFMFVYSFWKPVSSIVLIMFLGGMIPALLGRGCPIQPDTQRALLTYPFIFLICAFAFERVRRVYAGHAGKLLYAVLITAGIAASLWNFQRGIVDYFITFAQCPRALVNVSHNLYLMGERMRKHPDADMYLTPFYVGSDSFIIFTLPGKQINVRTHPDEMLALKREHDSLLFIGPFFENTTDIFRACFPNCVTEVVREKKEMMKDASYTIMPLEQSVRMHTDEFAPFVYDVSIFVPKSDTADFQTMLYLSHSGKSERIKVFGKSDFGEKYHGERVGLNGAVIVPEDGYYKNSTVPLVFKNGWKGWKFVFDGKEEGFGRPLQADGGIHFFSISGGVPDDAKGDLPLSVTRGAEDFVADGRVVAIKEPFGARIFDTPGPDSFDKPYTYSHRLMSPNYRMYDGLSMDLTFSRVEKAWLTVPVTGEYEIKNNIYNRFQIKVDGTVVFDNMKQAAVATTRKIWLTAEKPVRFQLLQICEGVPSYYRVSSLYIKGPGMDDFILAPADWFSPED
jgi:4-amino-4-deoxy-L-arabinose transferase-like glycosyltransferase